MVNICPAVFVTFSPAVPAGFGSIGSNPVVALTIVVDKVINAIAISKTAIIFKSFYFSYFLLL